LTEDNVAESPGSPRSTLHEKKEIKTKVDTGRKGFIKKVEGRLRVGERGESTARFANR